MPAYEDADDAYGGAWWEDPQFEILREFFDENGFPYELWYEGTLKDVFPYLLEQRYGIPAQKIENKTLSEIVEYLYSDWGEDLNVPVLRGAEWQGGSLPDDYNYYINRSDPDELYYFHSDHLGSGSVITNGNSGDVYQTLAYAPFGELLINLRNGLYDEPYKFTGYERDEETGFNYAHQRYQLDWLSIFTSVDPLAEKRPWMTGYNYCSNNPINRIDPTGMFDTEADAQKYQQAHGISGKIEQDKNSGLFSINDYDNKTSYSRDPLMAETGNVDAEGVGKGAIVLPQSIEGDENRNDATLKSNAGKILESGMTIALVTTQLDSPAPGPADAVAIFIAGGTLVTAGAIWIYDQFAHNPKKQSTGKANSDAHDKQYRHGGKNRPKNPNQRKGAEERKNKGNRGTQ